MAKLPSRCKRYSVGKEIGGAVYVHRDYEALLPDAVKIASKHIPTEFNYTVVKFVEKESCVSFILCNEFDSADEPVVGDILRIDAAGSMQFFRQPADPFIYHHKWLFVMDDYQGFDVERSKDRSRCWTSLPDVDRSRIGKQSYWEANVVPRISTEKEATQHASPDSSWVRSKDAMKLLKVSSCDLCHLREQGKIEFKKQGNAYLYRVTSSGRTEASENNS